mgnify:FL=1
MGVNGMELKEIQEKLGFAVEEFKHARDKFNEEAKKFGDIFL